MSTSYYQATEAILYSYSRVTSYVDDLREKLVEVEKSDWSNVKAIQYDKINCRVFGISRVTENNALAKVEFIEELNTEIIENEKFITDIDKVLKRLGNDEKQIIKMLYFKGFSKEKVMKLLKFKKDKFYTVRNNAVKEFSVSWFGVKALSEVEVI
ncbi:MAG: hypothetical protein ACRDB9_07630 [Cetobacterium sp.]